MSKETTFGVPCPGCNQVIVFFDYHLPHCPNARAVVPTKEKRRKRKKNDR